MASQIIIEKYRSLRMQQARGDSFAAFRDVFREKPRSDAVNQRNYTRLMKEKP